MISRDPTWNSKTDLSFWIFDPFLLDNCNIGAGGCRHARELHLGFDMQQGERRGPYKLVRKLGAGGMGTVYEAWDERLGRRVAVKFIHPHLLERADMQTRFAWEARTAARVEHPNVVRVYRVDTWEGQPVIEMQYVVATSLRDILRAGPLTPEQSAQLLAQLLEALAACHGQHVIHCDLKPGNLLVSADEHLWLTDFGVARALYPTAGPGAALATDLHGPAGGTIWYMPPESFQGTSPSPVWDLYAVGMVAFEMMAAAPPFPAREPDDWIKTVLACDAPLLRQIVPGVSPSLSDWVAGLIARDPAKRLPTAEAALTALRNTPEFLARPDATLPPLEQHDTPTPKPDASPRVAAPLRHRWLPMGIAAGLTLLFLAIAGIWLERRLPETPPAEGGSFAVPPEAQRNEITDFTVSRFATYFAFDDGIHGRELWFSNSDASGPRLLKDIIPGPASSAPRRFMLTSGNELYFAATTPEQGEELWKLSDVGGDFVVRPVRDILPGPMSSEPEPIATWNNLVLFYATNITQGRELWCTNGNEGQTAIVTDASPGRDGSYPMRPYVTCGDGEVYLTGFAGPERGLVFWHYTFEDNRLVEVVDVPDNTTAFTLFHAKLYFTRDDPEHGAELWVHDPTIGGATLVADLWPGTASSSPCQYYVWKDRLYFRARTEEAGEELWSTDGTASGTTLLADINPGPESSSPYAFVGDENALFFRARDAAHGNEPWFYDPNASVPKLVSDVRPGEASSTPYDYTLMDGILTFTADDGMHGEERFAAKRDGDNLATTLLADIVPGPKGSEPHSTQNGTAMYQVSVGIGPDGDDVLLWNSLNSNSITIIPITSHAAK